MEQGKLITPDICIKEAELAELKQKVEYMAQREDRFEKTLDKLDNTQEELARSITALNTTFNTLKYMIGILIALFGGLGCFLVTELIKMI